MRKSIVLTVAFSAFTICGVYFLYHVSDGAAVVDTRARADDGSAAKHVSLDSPEKIPVKLKPLIAMPDFPEKLLSMVEKAAA